MKATLCLASKKPFTVAGAAQVEAAERALRGRIQWEDVLCGFALGGVQ